MNEAEQAALAKATAFLGTGDLTPPSEMLGGAVETPKPNDLVPPAAKVENPPVQAAGSTTPAPKAPSLAEAIRADREAREQAKRATSEASDYKGKLEAVQKEVEHYKRLADIRDPLEFAAAKKLTPEEQALWGQAFLYQLKPEVAPQEFRLELYKAEQARKEREDAENRKKSEAEQLRAFELQQIENYKAELSGTAKTFAAGSNPASEEWFTTDNPDPQGDPVFDHGAYAESLFATANNLAITARKNGQQADLSPANVARVLDAEVAKRLGRRDRVVAARNKTKQPEVKAPGNGMQPIVSPMSTSGLGSGGPRPPAKTEEERIARAAAVLYAPR